MTLKTMGPDSPGLLRTLKRLTKNAVDAHEAAGHIVEEILGAFQEVCRFLSIASNFFLCEFLLCESILNVGTRDVLYMLIVLIAYLFFAVQNSTFCQLRAPVFGA